MILDKIENINRYGVNFTKIKNALNSIKFIEGKIDIDKEDFFAIGLSYQTKSSNEGLWEAHRKYLDIHVILEGEEIVEISDIQHMNESTVYSDDFQLFNGIKSNQIILKANHFLILFPNEVHKTSVMTENGQTKVRKFVFKLLIS